MSTTPPPRETAESPTAIPSRLLVLEADIDLTAVFSPAGDVPCAPMQSLPEPVVQYLEPHGSTPRCYHGLLAPFPVDPRIVLPLPSEDVFVGECPGEHLLFGQLRCVARRAMEPDHALVYAGEIYRSKQDHQLYSSNYSCDAAAGMIVDGLRYCNEAAFINHYHGIAAEPNCRFDVSDEVVAAVRTTRSIQVGEELLIDYGLEYCLRNQLPHPAAEDWARDLAAMSLLTAVSKEIAVLEGQLSDCEQVLSAGQVEPARAKQQLAMLHNQGMQMIILRIGEVQTSELSKAGHEMVIDFKHDLTKRLDILRASTEALLLHLEYQD